MKERILYIMEQENLTASKFAELIGVQRSAISHITSGRNNPSLDVLMKILEKFTYIDSDWLMFGKGNMRRQIVNKEPDLFGNTQEFQPKVQVIQENHREIDLPVPQIAPKKPIVEQVIPVTSVSRDVTKIMLFYSDNTFDTFIPEKNKKD